MKNHLSIERATISNTNGPRYCDKHSKSLKAVFLDDAIKKRSKQQRKSEREKRTENKYYYFRI